MFFIVKLQILRDLPVYQKIEKICVEALNLAGWLDGLSVGWLQHLADTNVNLAFEDNQDISPVPREETNLGHILDISGTSLRHILVISGTYLEHICDISGTYLKQTF